MSTTGRSQSPQDAQLLQDARALLPWLSGIRRALHAEAEVGLQLPLTQARVLKELAGLDGGRGILEVSTGSALSSVTAVLRGTAAGAREGGSVLLRADMDGLPVLERTGLDFASAAGTMHACGHDLHTAGLLGAVRLLLERRHELAGDVVFMFQPGEEGYGGARLMIEEGVLEAAGGRVSAAYGLHVVPGAPGTFQTRVGSIMASSNTFRVRVHGIGGHGSQPHKVRNPVPVVAEIAAALGRYSAQRIDVFDPVVISVTELSGSSATNVIPDSAGLAATVRTLSQVSLDQLAAELPRLAEDLAAAHGMRAEAVFETIYPVTVNDPLATAFVEEQLRLLPAAVQRVEFPWMGAEDFSFVLREVPGSFFFLTAGAPSTLDRPELTNHSPEIDFDESVLPLQAAALASLALGSLVLDPLAPDGQ